MKFPILPKRHQEQRSQSLLSCHFVVFLAIVSAVEVTSFSIPTVSRSNAFVSTCYSRYGQTTSSLLASTASIDDTATMPSDTTIPETRALAPHTFAGMVEKGLREKFENKNIDRVIESWRLLDMEYEHYEYHGDDDKKSSSNYYQQCHSYVPGLTVKQFWDVNNIEWATKLKKSYKVIKDEFMKVTADMEALKQQGNNIWASALTDEASAYGLGWKTLVLMDRGVWDPVNVNLFPKTAKAVRDCKIPAVEVFFTTLEPNSNIKPHSDFTNFVLTSHLGIDIPDNGENKCRLTIGDETQQWLNGDVMMFDTSILHDAINESNRNRYILMMRVWHPDLTQDERDALQFTYDSLMVPELVTSEAEGEKFMAEKQVEAMHAFPEIKQKATGFGSSSSQSKKNAKKKKKGKGKSGKGFGN